MNVRQEVYAALVEVLPNTHAVELPREPSWPAIVFDIESRPEEGWCAGGGYTQHVVSVVFLDRGGEGDLDLRSRATAALEEIFGFMAAEEEGDADYEDDAEVYAYFKNYRIRTRN